MPVPDNRIDIAQTTPIAGLNEPVWTELNDYTDPAVARAYSNQLQIILQVFQQPSSVAITQADADAVRDALQNLKDLAAQGIRLENPPGVTLTHFLTKDMASNLDLLLRSFYALGAVDPASNLTDQDLLKWKDLSTVSPVIQNIMSGALNAVAGNTSLQSLIELQYVSAGNDLIAEKLGSLQEALTVTDDVLKTLSVLQDLRNRMVVTGPAKSFASTFPSLSTPLATAAEQLAWAGGAYKTAASAYFNTQIAPVIPSTLMTSGAFPQFTVEGMRVFSQLIALQKSLLKEVARLSAIATPEVLTDANSLYSRVKTLTEDFTKRFGNLTVPLNTPALASSFRQFLLDNNNPKYQISGQAGDMQANLTFAITAAQGLNDTQKEDVRNFLFVFEEFYKSASAILQRISQMIEKMAQNISR